LLIQGLTLFLLEIQALIQENREVVRSIDKDNSSTAVLALYTLLKLNAGDSDAVKSNAIRRLVGYYQKYGPQNKSRSEKQKQLIEKIEQASQIIPELKLALREKPNKASEAIAPQGGAQPQR